MVDRKLLTGPEPEEAEQKTAAQLEDEKRPSAMALSTKMYDEAEEGDQPSIEQRFEQKEVKTATHTGKNFAIDKDFEAAMHEREKAEHDARMKARAQAAEEQKRKQEKRDQEISEKIQETQSLDPEELREEQLEIEHAANLKKLYPDPVKTESDVEDALWRKRTDKGAQIAGRAKLEDVYDSKLHSGIITSSIIGILSLILYAISNLSGPFFPFFIRLIFFIGSTVAMICSYSALSKCSKKYRKKKIPSNQENAFTLASILPFMALRIGIASAFLGFPGIGGIAGTVIGVLIGSSLHYTFLFKFQIEASDKIVLLNTLLYVFIAILPSIIQYMNSRSRGSWEMLNGFSWAIEAGIFLIGERFAAKLAPGHFNK